MRSAGLRRTKNTSLPSGNDEPGETGLLPRTFAIRNIAVALSNAQSDRALVFRYKMLQFSLRRIVQPGTGLPSAGVVDTHQGPFP
jgi:hypothetical protein